MGEMPRTQPGSERSRLGFAAAVPDSFKFLLGLGFRLVDVSDTLVRFESERRIVRVFHGRGSYELGVEVGRWIEVDGVPREEFFSLRDFISLTHDPADIGYGGTSATTAELVRKFVRQLADWTRRFGLRLFDNGDEQFDQLTARYEVRGQAMRDEQRAGLLRSRADEAWQRQDFATVANSYSEIESELPTVSLKASEQGRLNYALKALGESD